MRIHTLLGLCLLALAILAQPVLAQSGYKDGRRVVWSSISHISLASDTETGGCQRYMQSQSFWLPALLSMNHTASDLWACEIQENRVPGTPPYTITVQAFCVNSDGTLNSLGICPLENDYLYACPSCGNPINTATGVKLEPEVDFASPKDSRFSFERNYRSDAIFLQSPTTLSHGMGWGAKWDNRISAQVGNANELLVQRFNGDRFLFSGSGNMVPYRTDNPYALISTVPTEGGRRQLSDGTGKLEFYNSTGPNINLLDEIRWPDGYRITVTRSADTRIASIADNRGQLAQFTWDSTLNPNNVVPVLKTISIDTNYNGVTFAADVAIDFTYQYNPLWKSELLLLSATTRNLATGTVQRTRSYLYDGNNLLGVPAKLTTVSDGRLNGSGQPFATAAFTYLAGASPNFVTKAVETQHYAGADKFTLTNNVDGTVTQTNPLTAQTNFTFADVDGRRRATRADGVATTNVAATTTLYDYTPNAGAPQGYVYERTEKNGAVTRFTRDSRGLLLILTENATGASPRVTTFTWHATLRLPLTRRTTQMEEGFTYTPSGLLTGYSRTDVLTGSPTNGQTRSWTYTYTTLASGLNVLTSVDGPGLVADGVNDVTLYQYDAQGVLTRITDPVGLVTDILASNEAGQPTRVRLPSTVLWDFTYDSLGRVLTTTFDPTGTPLTTSFGRDAIGQITSLTNTRGKTWTYSYDEARRLTRVTDPNALVMEMVYDLMGNVTQTQYKTAAGGALTYTETAQFDALGRLLKSLNHLNQAWTFAHDVEDNLSSATDPETFIESYDYDALNRLTQIHDRASGLTQLALNDADLQTAYTDQRGLVTTSTYNGFGDRIREVSPDRGTTNYTYNSRGLMASATDARGTVSNFTYDNAGRMLTRSFPSASAENQTFTYDELYASGTDKFSIGRLTHVIDASGDTRIQYRANGTVLKETRTIQGKTYIIAYDIDLEGNVLVLTYPSGREAVATIRDNNEVSALQTRATSGGALSGIAANVTWRPFGPLAAMTLNDTGAYTATYDNSYRLTQQKDIRAAVTLRQADYTYTPRSSVATITDALSAPQNQTLSYNSRDMLASASGSYGSLAWGYDGVGNRLNEGAANYTYPPISNRLTSISVPAARTFLYDAMGNIKSDQRSTGLYTYTYDASGRMASVKKDGTSQATYLYNWQGQQVYRRFKNPSSFVKYHSLHDLSGNRIAEYNATSSGAPTLLREYLWLGGQPVAVIEGGVIHSVRVDSMNRPVLATNPAGTKVWTASYSPFGTVVATTGTPINLRFPGQWFQLEAGLNQNWMRDYDPTTGRYLQADPLGLVDGSSVYGYAGQSPFKWSDPRGEQTFGNEQRPFTSLEALPFDYHEHVWPPLDKYHNFPTSFDPHIWYEGYSCRPGRISGSPFSLAPSAPGLDWGYFECRCVDGMLTGIPGRFEIGVRVPTIFDNPFGILASPKPTVVHRLFIPNNKLRP